MTDVDEIIRALGLRPLEAEGGYFAETWRGPEIALPPEAAALAGERRALGTAIYYLITPSSFSALHRLRSDEVFHFYAGDPCQMLLLGPRGEVSHPVLGTNLVDEMRPQVTVPAGWWQGTRLLQPAEGAFALLGTTMAPGFHPDDFELAERQAVRTEYPDQQHLIARFFPST